MAKSVAINTKQASPAKEPQLLKQGLFASTDDKIGLSLLFILILTVYIIRSKFLLIPFERDEGIYSYFGKLVLEGKIPYKDFYEVKFPGLFYFYGLMVGLFGDTVKGMHTGFMYLNMLSIIFIYYASRNLFSPIAGVISATTFAFVSLIPNLSGFTVQAEHGVAFFISLGLLFYSLTKLYNKWYYFFLMGIAMGLAVMVKTSGVFLAVWGGLMLLIEFIFTKPRNFKEFMKDAAAYALGGILVVSFFFILIYMKGSFNEMIQWAYEHPKKYVSNVPFEEGKKYFEYTKDAILQNHKFFWYHSILAVVVCLFKSINFKLKFLAVTLLFFSFMTIVPGYYFYGHYWIQTIPGLALVAGLTYHCIITTLHEGFKLKFKGLKYVYLGIFAMLTFSHISAFKQYYFKPNYERILRAVYGNNPFPESMEIANWINANSKPEDNIVLIGSEPQIYFYTKKKSPSRHAYFTAIVNNIPEHKAMQEEFIRDTEKANPRYLVFFNHPLSLLVQPGASQYVFEWANKYVSANYHLVGLVDMIEGQHATYLWKEQIGNYKPVSQNQIFIYERNQ